MGTLREFRIAFSGLKLGQHEYKLSVGEAFFEKYHNLEIDHGAVDVNLVMTKKERMLIFDFHLKGWVELICDRCLGKYKHYIEDEEKMFVKRQNGIYEMVEEAEDVLIIPDDWSDFDVGHYVYEYIAVLLPMKRVHANDEKGNPLCDPKMLEILNKVKVTDEDEKEGEKKESDENIDPRWEALRKLKNNQ
ncbi:MAG: DUF177 domain-containing protein [Bacteroidales bacterium]|nr:DUF177 domain-containing protein [Bacteroidales bacterium]MCF8332540.1 DUF177 domain-containing protein [Bacteroidales bacterium]